MDSPCKTICLHICFSISVFTAWILKHGSYHVISYYRDDVYLLWKWKLEVSNFGPFLSLKIWDYLLLSPSHHVLPHFTLTYTISSHSHTHPHSLSHYPTCVRNTHSILTLTGIFYLTYIEKGLHGSPTNITLQIYTAAYCRKTWATEIKREPWRLWSTCSIAPVN